MKLINTAIPDIKIIKPDIFHDNRGYFYESYNHRKFCEAIGRDIEFVQENTSFSYRNVLRGLHYQEPHPQAKLIQVLRGRIYDVAVDLRPYSSTYKQWIGLELQAEKKEQLWLPEGFAHGFIVLSSSAEIQYKTSDYWYPECEHVLHWNDELLHGANWPTDKPIISAKDSSKPVQCLSIHLDYNPG